MIKSEIVGSHSSIVELKLLVDQSRMPHATLIYGPVGNTKLAIALWLCQYLMCHNRQDDDACGSCPSCVKHAKLSHPDLHFLYPSWPSRKDKSKAEDFIDDWRSAIDQNVYMEVADWMRQIGGESKQANISAQNCKDVLARLGMMAFEGQSKIMLIWMAQFLGTDGNRLLKLIEEPPEDTYLIMVAEEPDAILNTIRSRCLQIYIPALNNQDMTSYLSTQMGLSPEQSHWITQIADGNINQAIKMVSQQSAEIPTLWKDWMRFGLRWNNKDYVNWVGRFTRLSKLDQRLFFKYGIQFSRQVLRYRVATPGQLHTDKVVYTLGNKMNIEQIESLNNLCSSCLNHLERNGHTGIVMTNAGIQWRKIWADQKVIAAH